MYFQLGVWTKAERHSSPREILWKIPRSAGCWKQKNTEEYKGTHVHVNKESGIWAYNQRVLSSCKEHVLKNTGGVSLIGEFWKLTLYGKRLQHWIFLHRRPFAPESVPVVKFPSCPDRLVLWGAVRLGETLVQGAAGGQRWHVCSAVSVK